MNSANEKYGSSLDRPQGAGKPVDPATRLSELLAQSLEELTRPFDAPRGPHPSRPVAPREEGPAAAEPEHAAEPAPVAVAQPAPEPNSEQARIDADKALAELEAELFAAAKQVDGDASIPHEETEQPEAAREGTGETVEDDMAALLASHKADSEAANEDKPQAAPAFALSPEEHTLAEPAPSVVPDAASANLIARVRRLMLISMGIMVLAVGSVFGFVGYRFMKGEGATAKTADKIAPASAIPTDVTLSIPRNAKVIQSAVANDRLIMTLDIDGKIEVRTFDVRTLQPAGRLNFSATP